MLTSYFKIARRNLFRNKVSSVINIGGLTLGMAVAMLIGLWIYDELSYNTWHQHYDRIGRILIQGNDAHDGPYTSRSLPYPLATAIADEHAAEFNHIVRASWAENFILAAGDKKLSRYGQFMDAGAPELFTLNMLRGTRSGLKNPNSIMLCASTAKALFGNTDPLNQVIVLNNKTSVKVTGVYADLPRNTQLSEIQFLSTWNLWEKENPWIRERAIHNWNNHFLHLYAEIKPGSDFETVNNHISNVILSHIRKMENMQETVARHPQPFLFPMRNWHLYPLKKGVADPEPLRMVWLTGLIGLFVVLLACINFMNMSTARSEKRAKEVGIRKAIGSMRMQLVKQFFSESFIVVLVAFAISCLLVQLSLPWFNELAAKDMYIPWSNSWFWIISAGFIVVTGLLAGCYPALYLSSFKPVKVLKGTFKVGKLAAVPRKVLVVTQFTVSVALIICTMVVYRQVQFAKDRPVGYTREGLIVMEKISDDFNNKYQLFRNELLQTGVVENMSESMGRVTEVASGNDGFEWRGRRPDMRESFGTLAITHHHGRTVGWQFIAGRDFNSNFAGDSSGVVINEAAAAYMGLKDPVGETITWKWRANAPKPYTILGVIRNMVMESPYEPVEPTLFFVKALNGGTNFINIRVKPGVAMSKALPKIEAVFKKLVPAAPFDYSFVHQDYAEKFAAEERIGKLAAFFTILAVLISCLGLFGLASFVAEQRTREIGVRKVLGATIPDLWALLSKEFVVLVVIALLIAAPIAWYFMNNWLQHYQYRTETSWWIFASAGGGAILITLLTVSYQAIKTALANPVRSLRSE